MAAIHFGHRSGAARGRVGRHGLRRHLLTGVCAAAIIAVGVPQAMADATVTTWTQLNDAITAANASPGVPSTITLAASFSSTSAPNAVTGNITINTGAHTLTLATGSAFNVGDGAKLTVSGNVLAQAALTKTGNGDLVINGVTATGFTIMGMSGGTTLIDGGSKITASATSSSSTPLIGIGSSAGATATLTISGTGTVVTSTSSTQAPIVIGNASGAGTLNVEAGGVLNVTDSALEPLSNGTINVTGTGSAINARSISESGGTSAINILDGGLINIVGNGAAFGGTAGGTGTVSAATVNGVVSGAGSKLTVAAILDLERGTLSVLDGGLVTADVVTVATAQRGASTRDFDLLVSGQGSEVDAATSFTLGILGTGTLTIADDGIVVVKGGTGALTMGGTNVASKAILNIGGAKGSAAAAAGTLDASGIALAANAEINFNHTDAGYEFDAPITGNGAINQVAGRTIFGTAQLTFTGLTTVSGGTLQVDNLLGGTVDITGGTLAGVGTVGDTTLSTGGTIAPGKNGIGTLTVNGDYLGDGGTLSIQSILGNDTSSGDLFAVTGATSGTTSVKVTNLGGAGASTTDGIKIVDITGASNGIFALAGGYVFDGDEAVVGGAYAYRLYKGSISAPGDGDWYLRSDLLPTPPPSGPSAPLYQPGVSIYEAYANVLQSFNKLPTLQERVGNRSWSDGSTAGNGTWGRIDGSRTSFNGGMSTTGADHTDNTWRLSGGADSLLADTPGGQLIGGLSGQVGTVSSTVDSMYGAGTIGSATAGLGGSLTWYGRNGFYLDGQAQVIWYDSTLSSTTANRNLAGGNWATGYGLSLEAGQRIGLGPNWSITPQAQLAYSAVDIQSFTDGFGAAITPEGDNNLTGRLGVSADFDQSSRDGDGLAARLHGYGIANVYYDFGGASHTEVAGVKFANEADPLWGGVGLGGSYDWGGGKYSLYGEASVDTSLRNVGRSYGFAGTGGLRVKF